MKMFLQRERHTWLFVVLQLSVIGLISSYNLIPKHFNDVNKALHHVLGHVQHRIPSATTTHSRTYSTSSSSGGTSWSGSSSSGSSSSGSSSGGSSSGGSSSGGTSSGSSSSQNVEYYTVDLQFVQLFQEVRASTKAVKVHAQRHQDGLYKLTVTTDKGTKTYDKISKATFDLFAKLLKNPSLQIKEVGKVGSKVKIAVSPEPPKPTNIFKIKPQLLDAVNRIRKGGYSIQISTKGNKYTITVTNKSSGKKETYADLPTNTGEAFIRLLKDPSLQYQVIGKSGDEDVLFIPNYSGKQTKITVKSLFLTLLKQVRNHPSNHIRIQPGTDGKYELTVEDGKKQSKTYKHIDPNLLFSFVELIKNPNLQYKVSPAANGEFTVTVVDQPDDLNTGTIGKGIEYYIVKPQFVELIRQVRKSTKAVKIKYQPEDDGLLTVTLTTDKGTKTYKKIPRDILSLFVKLLKNPTLQITEVGKEGSNVKIAVSPEPPKPSNIITVKPEFLEVVKKIRKGGYSIQIATSGDTYTITVTDDSNGKKKIYSDVPAKIGDAFIRLVKNPSLPYEVLGKSGDKSYLFIPDNSATQTTFTVKPLFLTLLKQVREHPENRIQIQPGTDGKYELTIHEGKKGSKTYKHIDPNLLFVFIKLIKNPDLQFKLSPASATGQFTITLEEQPEDLNIGTIDSDKFLELITKAKSDPSYNLRIGTGKNGLELVITHNGKTKKYPLPAKFLNIIVQLLQSLRTPKTVKHNGQTTFILSDKETQTPIQVDVEFTDLIEEIKKNPTSTFKFKVEPSKNGKFNVIVFIDGKPKELKDQSPEAVKFLMKVTKNPKLPIHVTKEKLKPQQDQTTFIVADEETNSLIEVDVEFTDLIEEIKKNPKSNIKYKVEPSKNGKSNIIVYINGKPNKLKDQSPEAIKFLIKVTKNPNLPIHIVKEEPKHEEPTFVVTDDETNTPITVDLEFTDLIEEIKKNPTSNIKYKVEPSKNGKSNIIVYINGKPKILKDQTPEAIKFLIKVTKNPKLPIHIVKEEPKHDEPTFVVTDEETNTPITVDLEFTDLIEEIKKNPKSNIKYKVEPSKNGKSNIIVFINGKPKKLKDQSPEAIKFLIKVTKNPKLPIHIVKEQPGHKEPHHEKPGHKEPHHEKPGHKEPHHEKPGHKEPHHEKPGHKEPHHEKPGHKEPHHEKPGHKEPHHEKPGHKEPHHEKPGHKEPHHEKPGHKEPHHEKPGHKEPHHEKPGHKEPHHEKPGHKEPHHEKPGHKEPHHEKPGHKEPHHEKPGHKEPHHEKPGHKEPHHEKPGHKEPHHEKPGHKEPHRKEHKPKEVIHVISPGKTSTDPIISIPKNQLALIQTIKSAPQLSISIAPDGPNFKITVSDGQDTKTYPDITPELLNKLITIRNQKDLPFEITPSDDPKKVNINVPNKKKPDVENIDIDIDYLKPLEIVRHQPDTEIEIKPDNEGTFTVTIKPKDGSKPHTLKHVHPNVLNLISKLKTTPHVQFRVKSDKRGKIQLVVPKHQSQPVHTKLTPEIIDLIKNIKRKPQPKVSFKPEKPGTFTVVVQNGKKPEKEYKHISPELIPVITKLYSEPTVEYEIKPGKDDTIEFVPTEPSSNSHRYEVKPNVLDIIRDIKQNPDTEINVKPGPDHTFDIETKEPHKKPKTYPHVNQETLDLIIDLKSHPDVSFTVKPTPKGNFYITVPKSNVKEDNVQITPDVLELIKLLHSPKDVKLNIKPQKDGAFTVVVKDGKKEHVYPNIPKRVLPVVIKLYKNPHRNIQLKPTSDNQIYGNVPEDLPKTTTAVVNKDDVDLIHHIKRHPHTEVTIKRDRKNRPTVVVGHGPDRESYPRVAPNIVNLATKLLTEPKLPFHIYTGRDGRHVLTIPVRPKELIVPNVSKDLLKFVDKHRSHPNLEVVVTSSEIPDHYDVIFQEQNKPIKHFKHLEPKIVQLVVELFNAPTTEYRVQPQPNGKLTVRPSRDDVPTFDVPITPKDLLLIRDFRNPKLNSVIVSPGSKPNTYKVVFDDLYDRSNPLSEDNIQPLFLNFLVRLYTEPSLPLKSAVDEDGHLIVTAPKRVSHNILHDVSPEVLNFLTKHKPTPKDTFSIVLDKKKPHSTKPDSYTFDLNGKKFPHQSPTTVQLASILLSQPKLHTRILNERDGKATVEITAHRPNLVFRNVHPAFLKTSQIARHSPNVELSITRNPDNEINLVISNGPNKLIIENLSPIITQLFVAMFSRPEFPYNFYIDEDNSVTMVIRKDSLHPVFSHIKPEFFDFVKKVRISKLFNIVIKHDEGAYEVEVTIHNDKPRTFQLTPEELQLLVLFATYRDLTFKENKEKDGTTLEIPVVIQASSTVLDFAKLCAATKVHSFPEYKETDVEEPTEEPSDEPEYRLRPELVFEPKIVLRPEYRRRPDYRRQFDSITRDYNTAKRNYAKHPGRLEVGHFERPRHHSRRHHRPQGHELYYKFKKEGAYDTCKCNQAHRSTSQRFREF